jgi:hypothetical protein
VKYHAFGFQVGPLSELANEQEAEYAYWLLPCFDAESRKTFKLWREGCPITWQSARTDHALWRSARNRCTGWPRRPRRADAVGRRRCRVEFDDAGVLVLRATRVGSPPAAGVTPTAPPTTAGSCRRQQRSGLQTRAGQDRAQRRHQLDRDSANRHRDRRQEGQGCAARHGEQASRALR